MKLLPGALKNLPEFQQLLSAIDAGGCPAVFFRLSPVHRAYVAAGVRQETGRSVVLLCADEGGGRTPGPGPRRPHRGAGGAPVCPGVYLPPRGGGLPAVRAPAAHGLRRPPGGREPPHCDDGGGPPPAHHSPCAPGQSQPDPPPGDRCALEELAAALTAAGYTRCQQVEGVGQFALRGGILDFFSPAHPKPVRLELFGDEIDAMGLFDPDSQRRVENLREAHILPAAEVLPQWCPAARRDWRGRWRTCSPGRAAGRGTRPP